jgi:hypothetical protein
VQSALYPAYSSWHLQRWTCYLETIGVASWDVDIPSTHNKTHFWTLCINCGYMCCKQHVHTKRNRRLPLPLHIQSCLSCISHRKTTWNSHAIPRSLNILMMNKEIKILIYLFILSFSVYLAEFMTRPQAGRQRNCVSVAERRREFSLLHRVSTWCGTYPGFWLFCCGKAARAWCFLTFLVLRIRMHGSIPALPWICLWHKYFGALNGRMMCE